MSWLRVILPISLAVWIVPQRSEMASSHINKVFPKQNCRELKMDVIFALDKCGEIPSGIFSKIIGIYLKDDEVTLDRVKFSLFVFSDFNNCDLRIPFDRHTKRDDLERELREYETEKTCAHVTYCKVVRETYGIHKNQSTKERRIHSTILMSQDFKRTFEDEDGFLRFVNMYLEDDNDMQLALINLGKQKLAYPWSTFPGYLVVDYINSNHTSSLTGLLYTLCFMCPDGWKIEENAYKRLNDAGNVTITNPACYFVGFSLANISSNFADYLCKRNGGFLASFDGVGEWDLAYDIFLREFNVTSDPLLKTSITKTRSNLGKNIHAFDIQTAIQDAYILSAAEMLKDDVSKGIIPGIDEDIKTIDIITDAEFKAWETQLPPQSLTNDMVSNFAAYFSKYRESGAQLQLHFGLRQKLDMWGGWSYYWKTGTPIIVPRDGFRPLWDDSNVCIYASFKDCDNGSKKCVIEERSVPCWEKMSKHYMCEYPEQFRHEERTLVSKGSDNNDIISRASIRKCYVDEEKYVWLPIVREMPSILECVRQEFYIQGVQVEEKDIKRIPVFSCNDENGRAVGYESVCDFIEDCPNKKDEDCSRRTYDMNYRSRGYRECARGEFTCDNSECVNWTARCDLVYDCVDKSDEKDCNTCKHFPCPTGECIPEFLLNDGIGDCPNQADEKNDSSSTVNQCTAISKREERVFLAERSQCRFQTGNMNVVYSALTKRECYDNIHSWAADCIYWKDLYNIGIGCRNNAHLKNCENFTCPKGMYKCKDIGYCIPIDSLGDSVNDCPLGDDEALRLVFNTFLCLGQDRIHFLHVDQVCDDKVDCLDHTDESDCIADQTCPPDFMCAAGTFFPKSNVKTISLNISYWGSFVNDVKYIDMSGLDLNGLFPTGSNHSDIKLIAKKGTFRQVLVLDLSSCNIQDLSSTASFANTEDFHLVKRLDLSRNDLRTNHSSDNIFLVNMNNLEHLDLSHNRKLNDVDGFIRNKHYLTFLDLAYTGLTTVPRELRRLDKLRHVNFSGSLLERLQQKTFPKNLQSITLKELSSRLILDRSIFKGLKKVSRISVSNYALCCPKVLGPDVNPNFCKSSVRSISSCENLIPTGFMLALLCVVTMLTIVFNVASLVYKFKYDKDSFRYVYGILVAHLNASDLMMALYLTIILIQDVRFSGNYVAMRTTWTHSKLCTFAGIVSTWSTEGSMFFIFLISVDRFLANRYPTRRLITHDRATVLCICSWVLSLVISSIPAFIKSWELFGKSGLCNALPLFAIGTDEWLYATAVFSVLNFVIFSVICACQVLVFSSLFTHNRRVRKSMRSSYNFLKRQRNQERRLAVRLGLVVVTNFLCWFPLVMMNVYTATVGDISPNLKAYTIILILPMSPILNPIIYTLPRVLTRWSPKRRAEGSIFNVEFSGTQYNTVEKCKFAIRKVGIWVLSSGLTEDERRMLDLELQFAHTCIHKTSQTGPMGEESISDLATEITETIRQNQMPSSREAHIHTSEMLYTQDSFVEKWEMDSLGQMSLVEDLPPMKATESIRKKHILFREDEGSSV